MLATPGPFRLNQSPLGAFRQPQAPTIRRTHFVTEGPFANSGEVALSTALAVFRAISLVFTEPELDVGQVALLGVANVLATGRQA